MIPLLKKILTIALLAAAATLLANTFLPHRISWVQDWSKRIESKAIQQKIGIIPLSSAMTLQKKGSHQFIDARPTEEYNIGHIPGALSLPFQTLDDHFETAADLLDSNKPLIVYCSNHDCDDALLLASELKTMGAQNLMLYIDGFELWKKYGGAVEK